MIDPIDTSFFSSHAVSSTQQAQEASSGATGGELGGVASDLGAVIDKWQNYMNQALNQWYNDGAAMQDLIDQAKSVVGELQGMIVAYKNYENVGAVTFSSQNYDKIVNAMTALGIPQSQIQGGTINSKGLYHFTTSQLMADIQLMVQYMVADMPNFQAQLSSYQNDETKDLMAVMFCNNAIKMNEESLSGLLETLASLSQALMQNVQ